MRVLVGSGRLRESLSSKEPIRLRDSGGSGHLVNPAMQWAAVREGPLRPMKGHLRPREGPLRHSEGPLEPRKGPLGPRDDLRPKKGPLASSTYLERTHFDLERAVSDLNRAL